MACETFRTGLSALSLGTNGGGARGRTKRPLHTFDVYNHHSVLLQVIVDSHRYGKATERHEFSTHAIVDILHLQATSNIYNFPRQFRFNIVIWCIFVPFRVSSSRSCRSLSLSLSPLALARDFTLLSLCEKLYYYDKRIARLSVVTYKRNERRVNYPLSQTISERQYRACRGACLLLCMLHSFRRAAFSGARANVMLQVEMGTAKGRSAKLEKMTTEDGSRKIVLP